MTPEMELECLLVCKEDMAYRTLSRVLCDLSIAVDHCVSAEGARSSLAEGSHDLIVLEWEGSESSKLVHQLWSKHKKPTVVAICEDSSPVTGAHFTISKPVTYDAAMSSLRLAYSRMLLEYRLHTRFAVMTDTIAKDQHGRTFAITVLDIGDRGVGIKSQRPLISGTELTFALPLYGIPSPLTLQVRTVWTRNYGTAGCEILSMAPRDRDYLRDWLQKRVRIKKPAVQLCGV